MSPTIRPNALEAPARGLIGLGVAEPGAERQVASAADESRDPLEYSAICDDRGQVSGRIGLIGYGELARQMLRLLGPHAIGVEVHLFDDIAHDEAVENAHPFADFADDAFADLRYFVCLGYKHLETKTQIVDRLRALNRRVPSVVHPTAFVSASTRIGAGSVIYPMSNLDIEVVIGRAVLINNSVIVSHNCEIADGCFLAPGAVLSGRVRLGRHTFLGSGVIVSHDVTIGEKVTVGAGTVVTQDLPDGCSAVGNPARILDRPLRLK